MKAASVLRKSRMTWGFLLKLQILTTDIASCLASLRSMVRGLAIDGRRDASAVPNDSRILFCEKDPVEADLKAIGGEDMITEAEKGCSNLLSKERHSRETC